MQFFLDNKDWRFRKKNIACVLRNENSNRIFLPSIIFAHISNVVHWQGILFRRRNFCRKRSVGLASPKVIGARTTVVFDNEGKLLQDLLNVNLCN